MVNVALGERIAHPNIRRLDPLRHLRQVADVIEEGFGPDLSHTGRKALREMRWLSRLGPLLWWLVAASPDFREYHSGFVWLEGGRVVGTMNITRPGPFSRRWFVSNVAVRTAHRGRGIGRTLMQTGLAWAQAQGGEAVFLRVKRSNQAAFSLYESLGFQALHDAVEFTLDRVPRVRRIPAQSGIEIAPYRRRQWPQVRDLARAAIPPDLRWLEAVNVQNFDPALGQRLAEAWTDLTTGQTVERWVASRGERVVAALSIQIARQRGVHTLGLHVHPEHRGQVEEALLSQAMVRLWPFCEQTTAIGLPLGDDLVRQTLQRYGFVARKTLTLMRLWLQDTPR